MKKLLILFLLPLSLLGQKINGVYTRSALTAQRPPQCTTCLVIESNDSTGVDSVGLFVYDASDNTSVAGVDVIINNHLNRGWRYKRQRLAGAINFANVNYYTKAELTPILDDKVNIGSISSNYIPLYDASNTSISGSNMYQASGKIGVNTTTPVEQLHVNGNIKTNSVTALQRVDINGFQVGGNINQSVSGVTFGNWINSGGAYVIGGGGGRVGDWNYDDPYVYLSGNKGVVISTGADNFGNTAGIFVDTLRRVGIGTLSPVAPLHIYSNSHLSGTIKVDAKDTLNQATILFAEKGSNKWALGKKENNTFFLYDGVNLREAVTTTTTGNLALQPTAGNVAIGGTTASYKADITGDLRSTTGAYFATSSGNVGIGTTSTTYKTGITTSAAFGLQITTTGSNNSNPALDLVSGSVDMVISPDNANGRSWIGNYSNHPVVFQTNNLARVTVAADGKVGIGTTSPATSAAVDIVSTTGAFLPPRMTSTQRDALTATNGMVIYNSTTDKLQVRAGGAWVDLH